jgi:glucosamine-6-phosphate deaminase
MPDLFPRRFLRERLAVEVHRDRASLGLAAARAVAAHLRDLIATQGEARVIFACAPSQDEFLAALTNPARCGVAVTWERVTAFHMDDYVGLPGTHPQSFRHYLKTHLLDRVPVGAFHPLRAEEADLDAVCADYAALLDKRPIDLICLGIGENGHIAFNDPPVADFDDPVSVKRVALDEACRRQQVNDGCFPTFADVPTHSLTLTVPVFRRARRLSVHVPGPRKAAAVRATLHDPLSTACPATILRTHPQATLHLDAASAASVDVNAGSTPAA